MKKIIATVMMFMAMSMATAAPTPNDMHQLTEVQQAELALHVAKQVEAAKAAPSAPKQVEQWVSYGTQIGQALAGTAKELGVVANEFIQTPAGKFTLAMIIWKVMGQDIVHVGMALLMFFTLIPIWIYLFRRMCIIKGFDYKKFEGEGKIVIKRIPIYFSPSEVSAERGWLFFILFVIVIATVVVGLT